MADHVYFTENPKEVNDSVFGRSQDPIKMFIETKAEAFESQSIVKHIFAMEKSSHYAEKFTGMTAMYGFKPVSENGKYPDDMMKESFSKVLEHITWKDSFRISQEMVEDATSIDLKRKPAAFINAYYRTREHYGAALLGGGLGTESDIIFRGTACSVTTADGKTLFHEAHQSVLDTSFVQSNRFNDEFSVDALGELESRMQRFCGDAGEILSVSPDTIIIPADGAMKKAVFAAIGADKDPGTSGSNGFNYQFGRWNVIVWPYLNNYIKNGTKPWILMDSNYNEENASAVWLDRVPLTVSSDIEKETDANVWRGRARFVAGFTDWRAFAVGGVDSTGSLLG